jgi:hypothetical protein
MDEKEKPTQEVWFKENRIFDLNITEFYKEISTAIENNNLQTVYQLSKIFARYHFGK